MQLPDDHISIEGPPAPKRISLGDFVSTLLSRWGKPRARIAPFDRGKLDEWKASRALLRSQHVDINEHELDSWTTAKEGHWFVRHGVRHIIYPFRVGLKTTQKPKYHLTRCKSLQAQLRKEKTQGVRYRAAHTTDDVFEVELWRNAGTRKQKKHGVGTRQFIPCKDCLSELGYIPANIRPHHRRQIQNIVDSFRLKDYFPLQKAEEKTGETTTELAADNVGHFHGVIPIRRGDSSHFFRAIKRHVQFQCSECGIDLSTKPNQQYLTIHHKDRDPRNDVISNLEVLCIRCHAEKPGEGHVRLRQSTEYAAFVAKHLLESWPSSRPQAERPPA